MMQNIVAVFEGNIHQLDPVQFWVGLMIVACISLWAFHRMIRWHHHAQMISNVPTAKIRSAAQGYVELIGTAKLMDGPIIVSPLTSKLCVWYRYKIEEKVKNYNSKGMSNSSWRVVKQATSDELFLLEDDTGRCVIDPDNADVIVSNKNTWYKNEVIPPRRYTEELITENEKLYAIGLFQTLAYVESKKLRQYVSHLLRQWKNDPNQLLHQFDVNRDQELSPEEWERARLAAEREVKREHGQREKLEQLNVLKFSVHKDQSFILSTVSEQNLVRRYNARAFFALLGFFVSGSLVVWALNTRLGM